MMPHSPTKSAQRPWWTITQGEGPIATFAIHAGHDIRPEIERRLALDESQRLHEEDPYTDRWTDVTANRLIAHRSRFEVDLNRPRPKSIYLRPEDAWGLQLWKLPPPAPIIARSLFMHETFYVTLGAFLEHLQRHYGHFVILDLHSYNYRRGGPDAPPADPEKNPEVNLGTGTVKEGIWRPMINHFEQSLHEYDFQGRHLDVRENVNFTGGFLPKWVHRHFPESGCVLAIEFKKFFMNEWTGEPKPRDIEEIDHALASSIPALYEELPH